MKLNKKGWGMAMMIVLMSVLLVFLLIATVMVYKVYKYKESHKTVDDNTTQPQIMPSETIEKNLLKYRTYESKLKQNAITYAYTYYIDLDENGTKITLRDMQGKNIMSNLIDPEDNSLCDGYTILSVENEKIISKPYLKCNNYITGGYEDN